MKELALLGIVSFSAVVCSNIPPIKVFFNQGNGWIFLMFEIAHVMVSAPRPSRDPPHHVTHHTT